MLVTVPAKPPRAVEAHMSPLAELDRYLHARRQHMAEREWMRRWHEQRTPEGMDAE